MGRLAGSIATMTALLVGGGCTSSVPPGGTSPAVDIAHDVPIVEIATPKPAVAQPKLDEAKEAYPSMRLETEVVATERFGCSRGWGMTDTRASIRLVTGARSKLSVQVSTSTESGSMNGMHDSYSDAATCSYTGTAEGDPGAFNVVLRPDGDNQPLCSMGEERLTLRCRRGQRELEHDTAARSVPVVVCSLHTEGSAVSWSQNENFELVFGTTQPVVMDVGDGYGDQLRLTSAASP